MKLDVKPYLKQNRVFVPLRFIAETFGSAVDYINKTVVIETPPLIVEAPSKYSWSFLLDEPGSYSKQIQYDFLDKNKNSIKRFDIYVGIKAGEDVISTNVEDIVIHDVNEDQWYVFNAKADESIRQLIELASKYGFQTLISNTVV